MPMPGGTPRISRGYFRRPTLWQVILFVALIVMILPVVGLYALGIYQSALVRQTERQLIATGDVLAAQYRAALRLIADDATHAEFCEGEWAQGALDRSKTDKKTDGTSGEAMGCLGHAMQAQYNPIYTKDGQLIIDRQARLDLTSDPILPPEPDALDVERTPYPMARSAGDAMQQTLIDTRAYTLASVHLLDQGGQVIASSRPDILLKSFAHVDEVQRALRGEAVSVLRAKSAQRGGPILFRSFRAEPYRANVAMPITHGHKVLGVVYLGRTPNSVRAVLLNKWPELTLGIGVVLCLVVILTLSASFLLVRPLRQLALQAEEVAGGKRAAVTLIRRPGTHEIASLSAALTTMAHRLEERSTYIRGFAAQVSHEFKTPLTAIQGAIELLREHGETMSDHDRKKFLSNVAADSRRLEHLVVRLLELARADTQEPSLSEEADLRPVLEAAQQRSQHRGQPVTLTYAKNVRDPLMVAVDEDILSLLILNMLDNAYQHAGAAVEVHMAVSAQPGAVRILIADKGPGISDGNSGQIFAPFFTTARAKGGTGLGLSLVRSHLQSRGGSVALTTPPQGFSTAFSLAIPYAAMRKTPA